MKQNFDTRLEKSWFVINKKKKNNRERSKLQIYFGDYSFDKLWKIKNRKKCKLTRRDI